METPQRKSAIDIRVDQIGFCGELWTHHAEKLNGELKEMMGRLGIDIVAGEFFSGLRTVPDESTIDPVKFYRLLKKGTITEAQFLTAIKIVRKPATEFLNGKQLDAMSTTKPGTPRLTVTRKKGVDLKLTDSLKGLTDELLAKQPAPPEVKAA